MCYHSLNNQSLVDTIMILSLHDKLRCVSSLNKHNVNTVRGHEQSMKAKSVYDRIKPGLLLEGDTSSIGKVGKET